MKVLKAFKVVGIKAGAGVEAVFLAASIVEAYAKACAAGIAKPMFVAM